MLALNQKCKTEFPPETELILLKSIFGKEFLLAGAVDQEIMGLLAKLTRRNDDALQLAVVNYFEEHGIRVETQTRFLRALIPDRGILAGPALSPAETADVKLGYRLAKEIGRLDIGQSVVVKQGMVMVWSVPSTRKLTASMSSRSARGSATGAARPRETLLVGPRRR